MSISLNSSRASTAQAKNLQALVILIGAGTGVASLLISLLILLMVGRIANRPTPTLVQLADGTAIATQAAAHSDRTPEVIRKFVSDALVSLMNWTGTLPQTTPTRTATGELAAAPKDPGIPVQTSKGQRKVTTLAWQASFTLSEDFRQEFLTTLAEMMPPEVFSGNTEVVLVPQDISVPEPMGQGQWKVKVVANLIVFSAQQSQGQSIPFNKEVFVRAIDVPAPPTTPSAIASTIYGIRQAGLEITAMRELSRQNITQ